MLLITFQIDFNNVSPEIIQNKYDRCLKEDITEPDFCCVDIFNRTQNQTNCTIEKLLAFSGNGNEDEYPEYNSPGFSNTSLAQLDSYCHINYLDKDLRCPATEGCFEIRNVTFTKTDDTYVSFQSNLFCNKHLFRNPRDV